MVRLNEKELRQIALNVVPLLPLHDGDCELVFKFAREIRTWEKGGNPDDDGEDGNGGDRNAGGAGETGKVRRLKPRGQKLQQAPKLKIYRTYRPYVYKGRI